MTPVRFYGARGSAACERALALLQATGQPVITRDVITTPLSWDELHALAGLAGGIRHLLSVQAPAYRVFALDGVGHPEPEVLSLMAREPSLLRLPIVVIDDLVLVGFDAEAIAALTAAGGPA